MERLFTFCNLPNKAQAPSQNILNEKCNSLLNSVLEESQEISIAQSNVMSKSNSDSCEDQLSRPLKKRCLRFSNMSDDDISSTFQTELTNCRNSNKDSSKSLSTPFIPNNTHPYYVLFNYETLQQHYLGFYNFLRGKNAEQTLTEHAENLKRNIALSSCSTNHVTGYGLSRVGIFQNVQDMYQEQLLSEVGKQTTLYPYLSPLETGRTVTNSSKPDGQISLSSKRDKDFLSDHQCLVRENIEFYTASEEDVSNHLRGRNWTVKVGQVGVRCKHCKGSKGRKRMRSSSYFPLNLGGIYQAAQNIYNFHLKTSCAELPQNIQARFHEVIPSPSCYAGGKKHWINSAKSLGLIETSSGLWFKDNLEYCPEIDDKGVMIENMTSEIHEIIPDVKSIVKVADRELVTDYIFMIMCQMHQHVMNGDDENDSVLGLICRHCQGEKGFGIFNRTKHSTMSKNEYIIRLHKHLDQCSKCPSDIKEKINYFKTTHEYQKRQLKRGSRKQFLDRIVDRMNGNHMCSKIQDF